MAAPPDESSSVAAGAASPTERTPLLRDGRPAQPGGEEAAAAREAEGSDVPLAKEPSAKELVLILGSIWLGVFLAALGMYCTFDLSLGLASDDSSQGALLFTLLSTYFK